MWPGLLASVRHTSTAANVWNNNRAIIFGYNVAMKLTARKVFSMKITAMKSQPRKAGL